MLQRSHTRQCAMLQSLSKTVESLRAECTAVETQKNSAVAVAARRNACVASVNNVYQTMRTHERAQDELARAQKSLQQSHNPEAQQTHDDITAKCAFRCSVEGRSSCRTPACQPARATPLTPRQDVIRQRQIPIQEHTRVKTHHAPVGNALFVPGIHAKADAVMHVQWCRPRQKSSAKSRASGISSLLTSVSKYATRAQCAALAHAHTNARACAHACEHTLRACAWLPSFTALSSRACSPLRVWARRRQKSERKKKRRIQ